MRLEGKWALSHLRAFKGLLKCNQSFAVTTLIFFFLRSDRNLKAGFDGKQAQAETEGAMSKHIQFAIQFNCQSIVARNSIRKYLWYKQKCSLFTFIEVKRNMLLKQITFVANIVILSPVMAPKNYALLPV